MDPRKDVGHERGGELTVVFVTNEEPINWPTMTNRRVPVASSAVRSLV